MDTNNELRNLTDEEVDAVEGGEKFSNANPWAKWMFNYFFADNHMEILS